MDVAIEPKTQPATCACGYQAALLSVQQHRRSSKNQRCEPPILLRDPVLVGTGAPGSPGPGFEKPEESQETATSSPPPAGVAANGETPTPPAGSGAAETASLPKTPPGDLPGPTYFQIKHWVPVQIWLAFDVYRNRMHDIGLENYSGDFGQWLWQMAADNLHRLGFQIDARLLQTRLLEIGEDDADVDVSV